MTDLVEFLRARLDAAKAGAWAIHDVTRCDALLYEEDIADAAARTPNCDCGYPARVLREVEADRKLIAAFLDIERRLSENTAKHTRMMRDPAANAADLPSVRSHGWELVGRGQGLRFALMVRAERFADHPDYDESWRP